MNSIVRARIDEKIKEDASIVLAACGLTVSDAVRMMMIRIAAEKNYLLTLWFLMLKQYRQCKVC